MRTLQLKIGSIGIKSCDFLTWDDTPPPANPASTAKTIRSKNKGDGGGEYSIQRNSADKGNGRRVRHGKDDHTDSGEGEGDLLGTRNRKEDRLKKGKSINHRITGEIKSSKITRNKGVVRSSEGMDQIDIDMNRDGDRNRADDTDESKEGENSINNNINKGMLSPLLTLRIPGCTSSSDADSRPGSRSTSNSDSETHPPGEWNRNRSGVRPVPVTYVSR